MPDLTPSIRTALRSSTLLALVLGFGLSLAPAQMVHAFGAPESFADLAEQISPSVVNITTSALVAAPVDGAPMVPEGSPFEDFFEDCGNPGDSGTRRPGRAPRSAFPWPPPPTPAPPSPPPTSW